MLPFVLVILLVRFWMPFSLLISLIAVIRWTVCCVRNKDSGVRTLVFAKKVVFTQHSRPYTKFFNPRMSSSPGIIADSVPTDFITTQRRGCCFSPLFYCWYQHFQHVAQLETGPKNPAHFINPAPQQPFNPNPHPSCRRLVIIRHKRSTTPSWSMTWSGSASKSFLLRIPQINLSNGKRSRSVNWQLQIGSFVVLFSVASQCIVMMFRHKTLCLSFFWIEIS